MLYVEKSEWRLYMKKYDIFISYRRDGGDALAGRLADRFTYLGYKVFFDVESMRSGTFNTQILDAIAQCEDFILVLPPKGLDRCVDTDDWVRQELAFALKNNKNIIPVMMRGFEFPHNLPTDIEKVRFMQGISASSEYFDEMIERLNRMFVSNSAAKNAETNSEVPIKVPMFLKVTNSNFTPLAQKCLKSIETEHDEYSRMKEYLSSMTLERHLDKCNSDYESCDPMYLKLPFSRHEQKHRQESLKQDYNLCIDFFSEAKVILKKHLNIVDDSLLDVHVNSLANVQTYVSWLYTEKPIGYQTRIAEIVWLLFDFDYPLGKTYFDLPHALFNHMFSGLDMHAIRKIYYGTDRIRDGMKRKNKFEILSEVSWSIQIIATGVGDVNQQNEQIAYFFAVAFALYLLCGCA